MARNTWYLAGGALALVAGAVWWLLPASPVTAVDLVDRLPQAVQRRPSDQTFSVVDATLAGVSLRAVQATDASRLVFAETVPESGWLQVQLGVPEEAWAREGSAVLFMVGVSADGRYEELLSTTLNPFAAPTDRRWMPVLLDLSPWAGTRVEVVLNTRVATPTEPPTPHRALWGAPAIIQRPR